MVRLKWLKLKAFRGFREETRIDFPESGLVLIRGDSGAGKSSILLGISLALDMCPFPASELQNWDTEEPAQVQLALETPDGEVVIGRGKRNFLKIGGESITGAKAIAEGLRKIIGLDPETLQAITYRPQGQPGFFLSLTDAEKKDFLTKVLGLDAIEQAVELAEKNVKALTPAADQEAQAIRALEVEQETLKGQKYPDLQDWEPLSIQAATIRAELETVKAQMLETVTAAKAKQADVEKDPELIGLKSMLDAANQHHQNAVKGNAEKHKEFLAKQEQLRRRLQELVRAETLRFGLVKDIEACEGELRHALEGKCPTCYRTWEEAQKKAEALQAQVANMRAQLQNLSSGGDDKRKIEEALREVFVTDPMVVKLQGVRDELQLRIRDRHGDLVTGPMQEAQEIANRLNLRLTTLQTRLQGLEQQQQTVKAMNAKLEEARNIGEKAKARVEMMLETRRRQAEKVAADLNAERDFLALMGRDGFLGVIFDEVLQEIEIEANERLGRLANVAHVTIAFKSEVVTQKGTVNKTIMPVVRVAGHEAKLRSGLSGGMYTSVEGVVDLAVMAVVQRRTGSLPGFLFLDECFNGQPNLTKEAAMEVLQEYGRDKLVVVIDHSSEFKELFTRFVDVRLENGASVIV